MQLITDEYRKLNEKLHNSVIDYGKSGHGHSEEVLRMATAIGTSDILDYGCGKCSLANTIPFQIKKYDPAIRAFSEDPEPADFLVCTDVIEHIEPELLDNVLAHMKSKTKRIAYLVISTCEAIKKLEDGRNAHLIVKPGEYWFNKISEYYKILTYQFKEDAVFIMAKSFIVQNKQEIQTNEYNI